MKVLKAMREIDSTLNDLTKYAITLERDNMLLKKAIRSMAGKMAVADNGEVTMQLTQEDADFLKGVVDTCDVFGTGG